MIGNGRLKNLLIYKCQVRKLDFNDYDHQIDLSSYKIKLNKFENNYFTNFTIRMRSDDLPLLIERSFVSSTTIDKFFDLYKEWRTCFNFHFFRIFRSFFYLALTLEENEQRKMEKREMKEQTIMLTHRQDKGGKVSLCVTLRGERERRRKPLTSFN